VFEERFPDLAQGHLERCGIFRRSQRGCSACGLAHRHAGCLYSQSGICQAIAGHAATGNHDIPAVLRYQCTQRDGRHRTVGQRFGLDSGRPMQIHRIEGVAQCVFEDPTCSVVGNGDHGFTLDTVAFPMRGLRLHVNQTRIAFLFTQLFQQRLAAGHAETVELLLRKGADVDARDKDGDTALTMAEKKKHSEIVKILKKYGAKG
jgi:hypothetical protein